MDDQLYSNYVKRKPGSFGEKSIRKWHLRLLKSDLKGKSLTNLRLLEIGPGHGYVAEHCRGLGIEYRFCDTSAAVVEHMNKKGFVGHLSLIQDLGDEVGNFDVVWMSHVLEHCPNWLEARTMISSVGNRLAENGTAVNISPDFMNWRREFWNVDWSHGYPTTIRNVSQLVDDVGMRVVNSKLHRLGSVSIFARGIATLICLIPHRLVDRILTPDRYKIGDGLAYSWKGVFGWRQILITIEHQ